MVNFSWPNNGYLLLAFFSGMLVLVLVQKMYGRLWKDFCSRAPLLKKYWLFVAIFCLLAVLAYYFVLKYSPSGKIDNYIQILGQTLTLIFAIFVGYYAFLQVMESRVENLRQHAFGYFKKKLYQRAILMHEQIYSINPKDIVTLGNLLELYLITQNYEKFNLKLPLFKRLVVEEKEQLEFYYFITAQFLLKQYLREAREMLGECVQYLKNHPNALIQFSWDFSDMKNSEVFKTLQGDVKMIFDNFIAYLGRRMNEMQRQMFEAGNYELKPPPTVE